MVSWLVVGTFVLVILSFFCTEYLVTRFTARHQIRLDETRRVSAVLFANLCSLEILWIGGLVFEVVTGGSLYWEIMIACVFIQAVWAIRHLRHFQRDHLRMVDQDWRN